MRSNSIFKIYYLAAVETSASHMTSTHDVSTLITAECYILIQYSHLNFRPFLFSDHINAVRCIGLRHSCSLLLRRFVISVCDPAFSGLKLAVQLDVRSVGTAHNRLVATYGICIERADGFLIAVARVLQHRKAEADVPCICTLANG